jgi:hypothetical protein
MKFHHYEIWAACELTAFLTNTASAIRREDAVAVMNELNAKNIHPGVYYRLSLNFA